MQVPDEELLRIYRFMVLGRAIDDRMLKLQRQGRIAFYGQARGQEAATVASACVMGKDDWIFPALREGVVALIRGMPLPTFLAQCFGTARDELKGRQMPCHYGYGQGKVVPLSSPIGTQIPHGIGTAMAARIRGDESVTLVYLGDGATSEGDFHVGLNFAGVYRAPVVFFCQNNHWAISVPFSRQTASDGVAVKAEAYGMVGVRIDGNDAIAVYQATAEAVDRARRGEGPTLIEAVTYRLGAHSSSDDASRYRDDEEVAAWEARDPIPRLRRHLAGRGLWDEETERKLLDSIGMEMASAIEAVEKDPDPSLESLLEDVYAVPPGHLEDQLDELKRIQGEQKGE
jgi:TPP-dependent pyruvate/acetoin dehydrogenase alpha subunit